MIDVDALERLAAGRGTGPEALADRLERTLERRARLRVSLGSLLTVTVVLAGMDVVSTLRPAASDVLRPSVQEPLGAADPCVGASSGRALRAVAGALAVASLVGCSDAAVDDGASPPVGAVIEVTGDPALAGRYEHPQTSEAILIEISREMAEQEGIPLGGHAVTLEFLDDNFDWIRISGTVYADGTARLFPSFRIEGQRFDGPACDLEVTAVPPGDTVGTFTCEDATDTTGEHTVDVRGGFSVDLRVRDFGG